MWIWLVVLAGLGAAAAVGRLVNLRQPAPLRYRVDLTEKGQPLRSVLVYYVEDGSLSLVSREREVLAGRPTRLVADDLVTYLSQQPEGCLAPIPPGTRLLHVFVSGEGEATLNFSESIESARGGGILEDRQKLLALTRTVCENLPGVERIRLLVLNRPLERWGSHLALGPGGVVDVP
jgi:spore germination protein GerM